MPTPNDAINPGILHETGNPLFATGYARFVKFIPCSMATTSSVTHKVILLDVLQERHITRFTLGWTTCHPSNESASAGFKQATKPRDGMHRGQVTNDCVLHFWALVRIPTAFFRISLSSFRRRFSRIILCISASRAFPFPGNGFSGCSIERSTQRCSVVEPIPRSRATDVTLFRSTAKRTVTA